MGPAATQPASRCEFRVEHKTRIVRDPMLHQEFQVFLLECLFDVVCLLVSNVRRDIASQGLADAEDRVAGLPMKFAREKPLLLQPFRGGSLDVPHHVGHRVLRPERKKQMRVVRHPVDFDGMAVVVLDDARHVGEEFVADRFRQNRLAKFHAEDRVVE